MRFSLKDLMWSVTFASLGLASVSVMYANVHFLPNGIEWFLLLMFLFLPGALFGAAVGKLYHRTSRGIVKGLIVELVLLIVVWMSGIR